MGILRGGRMSHEALVVARLVSSQVIPEAAMTRSTRFRMLYSGTAGGVCIAGVQ